MKLTEKEFKKFNNRYIITHYIIPNVLVTIAILILFVVKTTNLFVVVCSLLTIVGYIVIVVINMKYQPTISIEKDSWVIRTVDYKEFSKDWLMVSSTFLAMFLLSCMTLYFVEADVWVKDKQETIIIDTISTEKDVYLLNHTDSINIIELAKIAELECASNFSDSLLKLEKSKPNRFEMQDIIQVIFNRVDSHHPSFKNTIYEVLRQDKQFQPYTSGKFDDYHCSNESIRIAKENYILWKTTGHSNSLLPKTVIGFCSAEYAESVNVVNVWNGWKRVEGKSLRVSANGMRLHYFYSIK